MWTTFKDYIEFLALFCVFGYEICGILAPQLGIELALPALEDEVLTTTDREVLRPFFKYYNVIVALTFNYSCKWLKFYKVLQTVKSWQVKIPV